MGGLGWLGIEGLLLGILGWLRKCLLRCRPLQVFSGLRLRIRLLRYRLLHILLLSELLPDERLLLTRLLSIRLLPARLLSGLRILLAIIGIKLVSH